jgi:hypothetical protein
MASSDKIDITKLFAALSSQITVQNSNLQDQIRRNDSKISAEFQTVVQANKEFKSEVRSELEDIRRLFNQLQNVTNPSATLISPPVSNSTFNQVVPSSNSVSSNSSSTTDDLNSSPTSPSIQDTSTQMMKLLTESFSKLSTVLADKQMDTKNDWPKFAGDSKKFRARYLAIMAQMSLPPWQELNDSASNDIVLITTNTQLNGKLYAKLLLALEGSALQCWTDPKIRFMSFVMYYQPGMALNPRHSQMQ